MDDDDEGKGEGEKLEDDGEEEDENDDDNDMEEDERNERRIPSNTMMGRRKIKMMKRWRRRTKMINRKMSKC